MKKIIRALSLTLVLIPIVYLAATHKKSIDVPADLKEAIADDDDIQEQVDFNELKKQIDASRISAQPGKDAAQAVAGTAASEIPCEKNADLESKVFVLRLKESASAAPREVRIGFNSCSRYAGQTDEERWFSDESHSIGIAVLSRIGSGEASVSFFQTRGTPAQLCASARFGKYPNDAISKTGFTQKNVQFADQCGGGGWASDVQLTPQSGKSVAETVHGTTANEVPCEKNADLESKVFVLRLQKESSVSGTPREVRIGFDSCSRYAGHEADEERWFSDPSHSIGIAVLNHIGSNEASVSFFQTRGTPARLCASAPFGTHTSDVVYKTGFTQGNVQFTDQCGGSGWTSDVQLNPAK